MKWDGLAEFRQMLQLLPEQLVDEGAAIVQEAADGAEAEIRAGYTVKSGNLQRGLKQRPAETTRWGVGIVLVNTAPHAWLWDNGSETRHYYESGSGARHDTGAMWGRSTAPHTFVRAAIKWRRRMMDRFRALLVDHGMVVRDSADNAAG